MSKNYFLIFTTFFLTVLNAQTSFVSWNFDTQSLLPSSGSGTISFEGGTGSVIYINNTGGKALGFADFPNTNINSGTAGIKFTTSTVGFTGISISFDTYGHNQSSKWQRYEYTTDGTTWNILSNNNGGLTSNFVTTTLNFPTTCDNNPNFAFRIVSIFGQPANVAYEQVTGGGYNGSNGKWYFDNVGIRYTALSTNSYNKISNLRVSPIPANDYLLIENNEAIESEVEIFDLVGHLVLKSKVKNDKIDISNLQRGIYAIKISIDNKTETRKLIVE